MKIKILVVEPNKEPYTLEINNTLENLQNIVGSDIENKKLEPNVNLLCNEYGKIKDLAFNRIITNDVICGTFLIVSQCSEEFASLTKKQIQKYTKEFKLENDKGVIEFLKLEVKHSSKLLNLNLKGIEGLKKVLISEEEYQKKLRKNNI